MVLLFFMDGVKYDMMQAHMPYLRSLNNRKLQSEFGYSCACHATMYTSRYIEEHGTWFIWKKGDHSPYKWINYVPGLKYINFLPLKLFLGKLTRFFSKNTSYAGVSCLVNLPLKYWPLFEPCDTVLWNDPAWKSEMPNLFTILTKNQIPHHVIALHRNTKADDAFVEECQADYANDDFIYYFIGYTDNIMHAHGENGVEAQQYFARVDEFIRQTVEKAKAARGEDVTVIAFSDHGHIDLEMPHIDIQDWFAKESLKVNDFVNLIEANYARFWFRNDVERAQVTKVVQAMQDAGLGYIMDQKVLEEWHLRLDPAEHGDLTFYLAAPHEFTNTIWGFGHTVKSGHGYQPTLPKHAGIFCSSQPITKDSPVTLLDILPSVMGQLGISTEGYTFRGEDILEAPRDK